MTGKENLKTILIAFIVVSFILLTGCLLPWPVSDSKSVSTSNSTAPLSAFSDVITRTMPSVVAISTESVTYDSYNHPQTSGSSGSGWIIDKAGDIVTNNHVVDGATSITVELFDHVAYSAKIVSTDPTTDVAVLKIDTGRVLQPLPVADTSNLRIGDWVIILGNPLGLGISAKQGIISRLGVNMSSSPDQMYYNLIETSAAVNPGNSGGPMINLNGEVIGITSLKIDSSGIEGMGYAITVDDVVPVIQVLIKGNTVIRPWLGASLVGVDSGLTNVFKLNISSGALITGISTGGPADQAKLKMGDVIVGFDDQKVTTDDDLTHLINVSKVGLKVKITYWRGSEEYSTDVILTESPPSASPAKSPTPAPIPAN